MPAHIVPQARLKTTRYASRAGRLTVFDTGMAGNSEKGHELARLHR